MDETRPGESWTNRQRRILGSRDLAAEGAVVDFAKLMKSRAPGHFRALPDGMLIWIADDPKPLQSPPAPRGVMTMSEQRVTDFRRLAPIFTSDLSDDEVKEFATFIDALPREDPDDADEAVESPLAHDPHTTDRMASVSQLAGGDETEEQETDAP